MTQFELKYCPVCVQMTNHKEGKCLKHNERRSKEMNELYYLHVSWIVNVLLAFLCGIVIGVIIKPKKQNDT